MASPTHPRLLRFGTEVEGHDAALHRVAAGVKFSFDLDLDAFRQEPRGQEVLELGRADAPQMMDQNG